MSEPLTPLTELEAINLMLSAALEPPVADTSDTGLTDVSLAVRLLHSCSRDFQGLGWSFNTDKEMPLTRNTAGEIIVPVDALHLDIARSTGRHGVQRGTRLYDTENHTYTWDRDLAVDIVTFLPFADLPSPARSYVATRAARVYQRQQLGNDSVERFTADDEQRAWRAIRRDESRRADRNIFRSGSVARDLNRSASFTNIPTR